MPYTLKIGFNQGPANLIASPGKFGVMAAPTQLQVGGSATYTLNATAGSYALSGTAAALSGPLTAAWPDPLPTATEGTFYTYTLTATGGVPPYTFSLDAGYTLPNGLSLNGATGVISGTPTVTATMLALSFAVTDSS